MSNYADRLRREKRTELAMRALPVENFNEYGEVTFAAKTEGGASFPAAAYAYVPDANTPSTWKLRLWASPTGGPDAHIVGAAMAALSPSGFRGNKVQIPADDLPAVKAKVAAAWKKANPDKKSSEMPSGMNMHSEMSDDGESLAACGGYDSANGGDDEMDLGDGPVSGADRDFLSALLPHHGDILALISKTEFADADVADFAAELAEKLIQSSFEIREKLSNVVDAVETAPNVAALPAYSYASEEFGSLPPFLKAGIVKNLQKQLAKESDPDKKAAIQAKIDKYTAK